MTDEERYRLWHRTSAFRDVTDEVNARLAEQENKA